MEKKIEKNSLQNDIHFDYKIRKHYANELQKRGLSKRDVSRQTGLKYDSVVKALNGIVYNECSYPWPKRYREKVDLFLAKFDDQI